MRGTAPETVRSQVKSLFAKTGTRGRIRNEDVPEVQSFLSSMDRLGDSVALEAAANLLCLPILKRAHSRASRGGSPDTSGGNPPWCQRL